LALKSILGRLVSERKRTVFHGRAESVGTQVTCWNGDEPCPQVGRRSRRRPVSSTKIAVAAVVIHLLDVKDMDVDRLAFLFGLLLLLVIGAHSYRQVHPHETAAIACGPVSSNK
jgi:hypothetical protein